MMSPLAVLLRSGDEDDPYEAAFSEQGFDVRSIPVLAFKLVNLDKLRDLISRPDEYSGLMLTSPRAVDALGEVLLRGSVFLERWRGKPVFVVGSRTADGVRALGLDPVGEGSGSAQVLARLILSEPIHNQLLFLSGDRRLDELPSTLRDAGTPFAELCVYETRLRPEIDWPVDRPVDWIVFFSPSGIEAVEGTDPGLLEAVHVAAIGETTATALRDRGVEVDAVATEPNAQALSEAVRAAYDRIRS
ncbi:MAG: uroporphyrinogen-III synthase [Rhodothermales bacterium]